ncbi:MAG TPA: hypothetical protein VNX86_16620 [Rhizomicrobium sp.]|jgi:hypothetical protein|nr:hypothetical protein [Rhizomicrobium sp.]
MRAIIAVIFAVAFTASCSVYPVAQDPDGMALRRNANEVLMALQAYHRDKGRFPPALAELVPAYMPRLPESPPLHYRAGDGSLSFRYIPTWPQLRPVWCSSVGDSTDWRCEEHLLLTRLN